MLSGLLLPQRRNQRIQMSTLQTLKLHHLSGENWAILVTLYNEIWAIVVTQHCENHALE